MKTKTLKPRKQNKNLLLRGFNQTHKDMVSWQMIMTNTHLQVQYMYTCKPSQTSCTKIYCKQCHFYPSSFTNYFALSIFQIHLLIGKWM